MNVHEATLSATQYGLDNYETPIERQFFMFLLVSLQRHSPTDPGPRCRNGCRTWPCADYCAVIDQLRAWGAKL